MTKAQQYLIENNLNDVLLKDSKRVIDRIYVSDVMEEFTQSKWREGYDAGFNRALKILDPDGTKIQNT